MTRDFFPGVGQAVADRTILRANETWGDVAKRVALGNTSLTHILQSEEVQALEGAIADGRILMSGRHLQHGDVDQTLRPMEVFTNCATASQRALLFYLLLNGSGVGTSYDDDMCIVDWSNMPMVVSYIRPDHPDANLTDHDFTQWREHDYYFKVPDSREGWAEAIQFVEDLTYLGDSSDLIVLVDFSDVRPKGAPIGGMQGRPSSGPAPLMEAMDRMNEIATAGYPLWLQAMHLDHILAEIVLVGGARRAARIAVKWWEDVDILDFINVKQEAGLWTANNSVGVDARFWSLVQFVEKYSYCPTGAHFRAKQVFDACVEAQYQHGTGEPGFLNLDLLSKGEEGPTIESATYLNGRMRLSQVAYDHRQALTIRAQRKDYPVIVNPCGEIRLSVNGGYCVIGDLAVAFCASQSQFNEAAKLLTRSLIRTNTMPALYQGEVARTNRIGVGLTGIHEYAWSRFGLTFHDIIAEHPTALVEDGNGVLMPAPSDRALPFWLSIMEAARVVTEECVSYSAELGVNPPLTERTIKPAGTTSKLFGLTEGAHLASMREYLRWVQFREDDPLVDTYEAQGYPVRRDLKTYKGVVIVGFPTRLLITDMMGENVVTAGEATPDQQVRWVRLLETYWLLAEGGNQISYTLKYDPKVVDEASYRKMMLESMPLVRAMSVMPQIDTTAYEYQPEEPVSATTYLELISRLVGDSVEDIGLEHVDCASGACPIDFRKSA